MHFPEGLENTPYKKIIFTKKCSPEQVFLNEQKFRKT
jgi:hypothetical protein